MSGPKISVYSLTGRARSIVFGQMRCDQQLKVCYEAIQELLRVIEGSSADFDQQTRNIELLMKRTSTGENQKEKIKQIQEKVQAELAGIRKEASSLAPISSSQYQITEEAYAEKKEQLKQLKILQKRAEELTSELGKAFTYLGNKEISQRDNVTNGYSADTGASGLIDFSSLQHDNSSIIQTIQQSILDDINRVSSFEFDVQEGNEVEGKKESIRSRLLEMRSSQLLPESILTEINQALFSLERITRLDYLRTFDSITLTNLISRVEAYKIEAEKKKKEWKEQYNRYKALCSMAQEKVEAIQYSEKAASYITAEVERLEHTIVHQQEQAYINQCVDEVMSDMGYNLIGVREVHKRSGKQFKNELFSFDEGTAVNITYSPDGKIAIELGGISGEDRLPSSEEAQVLTEKMDSFCGEFEEFERRMLTKGIVVGKRVSISPPSKEYATIINVNDYSIDEKDKQFSMFNVSEKRQKRVGEKAIRRNEEE